MLPVVQGMLQEFVNQVVDRFKNSQRHCLYALRCKVLTEVFINTQRSYFAVRENPVSFTDEGLPLFLSQLFESMVPVDVFE